MAGLISLTIQGHSLMAQTTSSGNTLERKINMSVVAADVEKDVAKRLSRMARTIKMPGFRPGKVPMKLVEQQFAAQARSEAFTEAVQDAFGSAVREQNLRVAGVPKIEPLEASEPGHVGFSATFEVYPEISIADLSSRCWWWGRPKLTRPLRCYVSNVFLMRRLTNLQQRKIGW
jgi:trigger factor